MNCLKIRINALFVIFFSVIAVNPATASTYVLGSTFQLSPTETDALGQPPIAINFGTVVAGSPDLFQLFNVQDGSYTQTLNFSSSDVNALANTIACGSDGCPSEFDRWEIGQPVIFQPLGGSGSIEGLVYGETYYLAGTLSQVPVPAAFWLFGSGLLGLIGIARRKKL